MFDENDILGNMFKLTGMAVWLVFAVLVAYYFLFEILLVGLANTFSYLRWEYRCSLRLGHIKPWTFPWRKLPQYLRYAFGIWISMWGYRDSCRTYRNIGGGVWFGINNWELSPMTALPIIYKDIE